MTQPVRPGWWFFLAYVRWPHHERWMDAYTGQTVEFYRAL